MNVIRDGKTMVPDKKSTMLEFIQYYSRKGVSDKTIATMSGVDLVKFYDILELEQKGVKPFKLALAMGRAQFEIDRVEAKDSIMNDAEISLGLKYKIVREDLKTLEEWSPATRAVKIQVEDAASVFTFDAYTEKEQEEITSQHSINDNTEED
jgi:hypothetical protein